MPRRPAPGSPAQENSSLQPGFLTAENLANAGAFHGIAQQRGQSLAQMAIAWVLRNPAVTSVLIGASRVSQIEDCVAALKNRTFSAAELAEIDRYAQEDGINLWAASSAA